MDVNTTITMRLFNAKKKHFNKRGFYTYLSTIVNYQIRFDFDFDSIKFEHSIANYVLSKNGICFLFQFPYRDDQLETFDVDFVPKRINSFLESKPIHQSNWAVDYRWLSLNSALEATHFIKSGFSTATTLMELNVSISVWYGKSQCQLSSIGVAGRTTQHYSLQSE